MDEQSFDARALCFLTSQRVSWMLKDLWDNTVDKDSLRYFLEK
jgi:hypothetical protein